jgi:transposase
MVVVDGAGVPLGICVTSAAPGEATLVDATVTTIAVPRTGGGAPRRNPRRLIADRAYDSDGLRRRLAARGITFISPYRSMRVNRPYEDRRLLRRYRHRWIIERTFAWLASFRRLSVRYERDPRLYVALFHFAAALIALRRF